ncbi:MAG: hypothetical protein GX444_08765 [Myxococcales bacterium]|nr:hypothetical protein [Myxococcales bacterium]
MSDAPRAATMTEFLPFDRRFLAADHDFSVIGEGEIGGKAHGLAFIKRILAEKLPAERFAPIVVGIPKLTVITTQYFDLFMEENRLYDFLEEEHSDERIAHEFQRAELSPMLVGDLWSLVSQTRTPLAVRSSSLLEDALARPFAGIYETKMIPNNQPDPNVRFQKLIEAVKFVYASTFFQTAREYMRATGIEPHQEKMAVIIQEVIGERFGERFYPVISGVGRSYTYYAFGGAKPEDGVVNLALGLGKTIVDGGTSWTYSPRLPRSNPPYNSLRQLLDETQKTFWAVNMGRPPAHDPIKETEYLSAAALADAEYDDNLRLVASTYDGANDRLEMGTAGAGPRAITFAPLLVGRVLPLNEVISELLAIAKESLSADVEIEFAATLPKNGPIRFGFLQVRPMVVSREAVEIDDAEMSGDRVLLSSASVLGNGIHEDLRHIVYVKPDTFSLALSTKVAAELATINRALVEAGQPYLLIGFGRWGSSDPWLGIPVTWGQIGGARTIVEAMLEDMNVDLSQGSHFFHNINAFQVSYFSVRDPEKRIDWSWLAAQPTWKEKSFVRCVALNAPLCVKVDGRRSRGVILK